MAVSDLSRIVFMVLSSMWNVDEAFSLNKERDWTDFIAVGSEFHNFAPGKERLFFFRYQGPTTLHPYFERPSVGTQKFTHQSLSYVSDN